MKSCNQELLKTTFKVKRLKIAISFLCVFVAFCIVLVFLFFPVFFLLFFLGRVGVTVYLQYRLTALP